MSQTKDQDQSMEEILQSIKRIIAEEGTPTAGSDVLELTDMIDDSVPAIPPGMEEPAAPLATMSIEEIMAAPLSSGGSFESPPLPKPEPAAKPEPAPVAFTPPLAPAPQPEPAPAKEEALVSDSTLNSAAAALSALKNIPDAPLPSFTPSNVGFRSGTTVEDLVLEALKPMLKEWLDANLTGITERLVEKEVRKLSNRT
jgi:hypothetical protein